MYLNKAILIGNLTRDPELRSLPSGSSLTSFSIATNRTWKDKEGNKQESTDFHNIVVFGKQAENVAQYLTKGSSALIEGRIQTRSWDDQDGNKKYRTEIVADRVQFGAKKDGGGGGQATAAAGSGAAAGVAAGASTEQGSGQSSDKKEELDTIEYPDEDDINPDDIPF
jgi:single-strand DNA-binding protein